MRMGRQGDVDRKRRSCSGSRNGTPAAKGPPPAASPGEAEAEAQLDGALRAAAAAVLVGAAPAPGPSPGLTAMDVAAAADSTEALPASAGPGLGGRAPAATPASVAGAGALPAPAASDVTGQVPGNCPCTKAHVSEACRLDSLKKRPMFPARSPVLEQHRVGQHWDRKDWLAADCARAPKLPALGELDAAALAAQLAALMPCMSTPASARAGSPARAEEATPAHALASATLATAPPATPAAAAQPAGLTLVPGASEWTVQIPAGLIATPAPGGGRVAVSIPKACTTTTLWACPTPGTAYWPAVVRGSQHS